MGRGRGRGRGVTGVQWNYDAASTAAESASLLEPAAALHERTERQRCGDACQRSGKGGRERERVAREKAREAVEGGGRGGGGGGSPEGLEADLDTLSMSDEPGVQEPPAAQGGGKGKGKGKGKGGGGGGGGGEAVQKMDNSRPDSESLAHVLDKRKPYWWRRLTEVDPISLEPIKALRFPPFELGTASADVGIHATYFDGRVLANYLVSTGSFMHPISRRELTPDECVRLDEYLTLHKLGDAGVLKAFELKDQYKNGVSPRPRSGSFRRPPPPCCRASTMEDLAVTDREAVTRAAILGRRRPTVHVTAAVEAATTTTHRPTAKTAWLGETSTRGRRSLSAARRSSPSRTSLVVWVCRTICARRAAVTGWVDREQRTGEARTCSSSWRTRSRPGLRSSPSWGAAGAAGAAAAVAAAARTAVVAAGVDRACLAGGPTRTAPSP